MNNMRELIKQSLFLGGVCLIAKLPLSISDNMFIYCLSLLLSFTTLLMMLVLAFRKTSANIATFIDKHKNISTYIIYVGWVFFIDIAISIIGVITGYYSAMHQYDNTAYETSLYKVSDFLVTIYNPCLLVSIVVATVIVLYRLKHNKKSV